MALRPAVGPCRLPAPPFVVNRTLVHPAPRSASNGRLVKLMLTSAGVKNESILKALVGLLGKPIADCHALCNGTVKVISEGNW